ncbi:MAG TPA: MarR family transcriptional regulator [Bradyrhizobium sp.]|nr:MarR family transcriptional regulator [Bradyrhizobium sp.]
MSKLDSIPLAVTHQVRDSCLCLHAQRAARALARRFDEELAAVDLSSGQFSLLISLNRPEPPSLGAVAKLLAMDRTTLTANLKPLQRRGLVKVAAASEDRRSRLLQLTPAGKRLLAKAVPIWRRTHRALDRGFSQTKLDALRAGLLALSGD